MKSEVELKFIPPKLLSLFLLKNYENLIFIEKSIATNPKNHWVDNFCLGVYLFMFILYLDCCCNEHTVKQRAFLCMKLPLEPAFFSVFLLFLES